MGLDRSVRHRFWGHPSSALQTFLQPLFSCSQTLGLQRQPPKNGSAWQGFGFLDLSRSQHEGSQKNERSRLFCLPTSVPLVPPGAIVFLLQEDRQPVETRTESQTGRQSPWESREERVGFPGPPGRRHPSLAATSCPMPSRMYTDWISLVLRQRSQAQTAEASVVSSP